MPKKNMALNEDKNCKTTDIKEKSLKKETFKLALPAIGEMLMQTLLGFADMAMVGSLGPAAIAAIGLSDMPMMTAMSIFASVSVGTTALVARAIGAKKPIDASDVAKQSLLISVVMALVFTLLGLMLSKSIVILMGAQDEVIELSNSYFRIVTLGLPFMIITMIMSGVLRGSGDTRTPMYINGFSSILNIVGNFFLIYKSRFFTIVIPFLGEEISVFIPGAGLGVDGAAISTSISRTIAGLIVIFLLVRGNALVKINFKQGFKFDFAIIKRIFNIGIPAAIEQFLMRFGQLLYGRIVSGLGTVLFAAHRITLTAESLSFNAGFGFALAATTLVGQYLGAEEPKTAQKSGFIAVGMGALFMTAVGSFFFLWPDTFLKIFTRDAEILNNARWCLRIVALSQPFLAAVMGFSGALRGAGDTKRVLVITIVGIWGVRLTLAYYFVKVLNFGLIGAWVAMTIDLIFRGIIYFINFKGGKWKNIKV